MENSSSALLQRMCSPASGPRPFRSCASTECAMAGMLMAFPVVLSRLHLPSPDRAGGGNPCT